ncbi:hypothetical protein TNIN_431641 [Trichonephila inaurata madagascariensis]|uniref:Uncharacterized protein n=1 Tax=Trichonephila inaurata madagascariensis TaxID=2747483 RepID=A0A8X6X3B4_9ARAC|nr:hypothetical protein TNIN_431641 [Trichonephila inaurata madagascariensis]
MTVKFIFLNILEPSSDQSLPVFICRGQVFYKAKEFGMLMGYKRSLEMIRNFLPTSRLCLRDVLPCPLESMMLPMSKNCRVLNHEEVLALFFKMEKREHVKSIINLKMILGGGVKLNASVELKYYYDQPLLSCRCPPTFTVEGEGIISFPELQESFKDVEENFREAELRENEKVFDPKVYYFMLHYGMDGKPKKIEYYDANDPENKCEYVRC